jgi:hypothetical protein
LPQRAHFATTASAGHAVFQQLGATGKAIRVVLLAQRQVAPAEEGRVEFVAQRSLLRRLSSMLMRSMPSVYSAMRGSGITTSSLILKALVWRLMAAVRLRSSQNFLRASGLMAMKPSPRASWQCAPPRWWRGPRRRRRPRRCRRTAPSWAGRRAPLALGGVAHGLQVAVVQVLQTRQQGHAAALLLGKHEVLDLDDAGHGVFGIAKELQAHGARVLGHAVHHPARAGDQAVAAFFLDAGQARQKLVGHVLAQALLAEARPGMSSRSVLQQGLAIGLEILQLEAGHLHVVDLAQVVVQAGHFQPLRLRASPCASWPGCPAPCPTARPSCRRRSWRCCRRCTRPRRGRVHRKHKAAALGRIGHALRDHAGFGPDGGHGLQAGQAAHLDLGHGFELFGVDDGDFQVSGIAPPV